MYNEAGYSLYGQNMRGNQPNLNPNNNNRMPNNIYLSQYNNSQPPHNYYPNNNNQPPHNYYPNNSNINPRPNNFYQNSNNNYNGRNPLYQNKINGNQNMNNKINYNMPNNNKIMNSGKKYDDLEIEVSFRNENNSMNLTAKDLETKNELEVITTQFMDIINNINELSGKGPKAFSESNQLNSIKEELKQIDSFSGNEYSNFIGELLEVSKNDKVLELTYDAYKKNPKKTDEEIKKIISEFKYDIVKFKNKDNSKENIKKINNYIDRKTKKVQPNNNNNNNGMNDNFNNNNNFNDNDNFNNNKNNFNNNNLNDFKILNNNSMQPLSDKFSIFDDVDLNQGSNDNQRPNTNNNNIYNNKINYNGGNSIYNTGKNNNSNNYYNNNNGNNNYNPNKNTYSSGSNSIYNQNKPKYEDPNDISDYSNYNFEDNSKKYSGKINVQFSFDGKETLYEIDKNESGEILQVYAMEETDDPKIYTLDGRNLTYEILSKNKVGDIFKDCKPILNIY